MSRRFGPPVRLTTLVVLLVGSLGIARAQDAGLAPEARVAPVLSVGELNTQRRRLSGPAEALPLASVLAVEVGDDDAVAARISEVDQQLSALAARYPNLGRVDTSSTSTAAVGVAPSLREAAVEFKALQRERDFLSLDRATRLSRLHAYEVRRMHRREQAEASARAREAAAVVVAREAGRRALDEAQRASTESLKTLKGQLAAVARARADLAAREKKLAEQQAEVSRTHAKNMKKIAELITRESSAGRSAARGLFGEMTSELTGAVRSFRTAIRALEAGVLVPNVELGDLGHAERGSPVEQEAVRDLRSALTALRTSAATYHARQRAFRVQAVETAFERASVLADARARLLSKVSKEARVALTGLSEEGLVGARLEAELLALEARAQPTLQAEKVHKASAYLQDVAALGMTFWVVTKIIVVIVLAVWVRRQGPALKVWFRSRVRSRVRSVVRLRRLEFLERNVEVFGGYVVFLAGTHGVSWALGSFGNAVEVELLLTTILWVAYYGLLRTWLNALVLWLAHKRRAFLGSDLRRNIQRSTALVGGTVLAYGLLRSVAVRILRPGVLYHFAWLLFLAGVVMVVIALVRRWRDSIVEAYVKKWPDGFLVRRLEASAGKVYNLLFVVAALGLVLVSGVAVFAKQSVMGFDQYRKALAYLFRKRLERKSDASAAWDLEPAALPEALQEAFTLEPLDGPHLRLDHFPGLDKLKRDLDAWREGRQKGSFLLRASRGYGKTTWIYHALEWVRDVPAAYLAIERRDATAGSFHRQVGACLGVDGETTHAALVAHLREGPRRLIAVDDAHHLFFRRLDGGAGFDALMDLIEDTGDLVFWVCVVDDLAWRHIRAARPTRIHFRAEFGLPDWPEDRLRALLMLRSAHSGISHAFEDLVVSSESDRPEDALVRASEGYTRLIWDYSDGCPLVALRFWLHSLVPETPDRVRVRLFKEPDEDRLRRIPEEGVFIYAAVANHGSLTPAEAAEIAGYPEPICEAALVRGVEEGYLERSERGSRFELAVDWQRQMIRFLKARQAL